MQIFRQNAPGRYDRDGQLRLPHADARVARRSGLLFGIQQGRELAVRLQNGEFHGAEVENALLPQVHGQLVEVHACALQIPFENFPVLHENDGLAAQQAAHPDGPQRNGGEDELQPEDDEDRHEAGQQGNGAVLHGDGGQIGQQHGHNEFRRLHLADLPLAHQADGHDEQQI